MYTKHHTEGLILKSFERGEKDRAYAIFTKGFGLVYAHASGVRSESSKLCGAIQDLAYIDLVFIQARDRWRITDARNILNTWTKLQTKKNRELVARMLALVNKMLAVHDPQPELFETVVRGILFLSQTNITDKERANLEILLALRILKHLGYLGEEQSLQYLLSSPFVNDIFIFEAGRLRHQALSEINRSMKELQF